ncbi:hypothetical protein DOT_2604 [Desulfosporosinus sp. OT]|uniref:hypothetical protein n=2 Tax=unclassified Desulfosporosinus TaxID=2633794 RepID=UPI0002239CCC|nr:hypothetical protein [Desulfosporosinus sp. BG]EGW39551.1 hypothetical protein DOT_2604 [Desulfosporosinus sp. OT]ODA38971.1 Uracil phosphoribosyltransferase [Desulfosporosinus sp. BG]
MPNLASNKYMSKDKKNKREAGDKAYPIWLLINPKHTAVRHNIWTPVLAEIQDKVYREIHTRIDSRNIYIRNAVKDSAIVPKTLNWWGAEVSKEIELFREIVFEYKPKILITFGAFPYEFMRRVYEIKPEKGPKSWGTAILGNEFGRSIENFDINKTNKIPLLRRVVTSGKFIEDYNDFSENYFQYVGSKIADKLIENKDSFNIWIE